MNINYFTGFDLIYFGDAINGKQIDGSSDKLEWFIDSLPHGSGIDCTWGGHMPVNGRYVYFSNSYHCMDENGFYDGYQDFTLRLDKKDFIAFLSGDEWASIDFIWDFKIQFNNGHYLADKHMLKDYLDDLFAYVLGEIVK